MTPEQRWLSRRYILYKGLSSLWFGSAVCGLLNTQGRLEYFFVVWGVLIFASVLVYLKLKKNDMQLETVSPIG
ncbi:MAG: hypothetical protein O2840_04330 [bacterium]|nr:hypothetical protein [bacterium]